MQVLLRVGFAACNVGTVVPRGFDNVVLRSGATKNLGQWLSTDFRSPGQH